MSLSDTLLKQGKPALQLFLTHDRFVLDATGAGSAPHNNTVDTLRPYHPWMFFCLFPEIKFNGNEPIIRKRFGIISRIITSAKPIVVVDTDTSVAFELLFKFGCPWLPGIHQLEQF